MTLTIVNPAFERSLREPDALLDRYHSLTGWADAVAACGVDVSVVQGFGVDAETRRGDVVYRFCRVRPGATGVWDLERLAHDVADLRPDVLHVNGVEPWPLLALRRRLPQTPMVVQHHGGRPPRRLSRAGWLCGRALPAADAVLFTTREQAEPWVEAGYVVMERVHAVLEASTRLQPLPREAARVRTGLDGSPALLWVGRLDANKDPLTVLAGAERAAAKLPGLTLTMAYTDAPLLAQVQARVEASAVLRNRVRLLGQVPHDELAAWFSAADIFVLGSREEAAGYALIEACACGTTPVVTDIAPFRAIAGAARVGVLWRPGDADDCARAVCHAAAMHGAVRREQVLAHFRARLSWSAVASQACAVYRDLITSRTLPGAERSA